MMIVAYDFYQELKKELEEMDLETLKNEVSSVENGNITPEQWCQDMMLLKAINQEMAAKYLKNKLNIEVALKSEPEVLMQIK